MIQLPFCELHGIGSAEMTLRVFVSKLSEKKESQCLVECQVILKVPYWKGFLKNGGVS